LSRKNIKIVIYDDLWKIAQKKGVMANPLRVGVIDP
jgi:hypothetical protein